jgi:DUF1680 family protein
MPAIADRLQSLPPGSVALRGPMDDKIRQLQRVWFDDQTLGEMADVFRQRQNRFAIGEFWGKAVRALCRMHDYTQDPALKAMLERTAKDLISTQTADGCISHRSVDTQPGECDLWGRKYALWGLESCYEATADRRILDAMVRMADHTLGQVGPPPKVSILNTGWHYQGIESSSILEPILKLYRLTGQQRYLDFAHYIVRQGGCRREHIFEAALSGKDVKDITDDGNRIESLSKTYEMISNFEGLVEYYRITGDTRWKHAVEKFFTNVVETEITLIGSGGGLGLYNWWGRAAGELWNYAGREQTCPMCEGIEGCTAPRWFVFCQQLLRLTGDPVYADQIELTVHNALLGSIRPDGSRVDYHTNLSGIRPGSNGFWTRFHGRDITCCVYNVVDAMALIPVVAVMRDALGPVVNLYFPGTARLSLPEGNTVVLETETDYPRTGTVRLRVSPEEAARFPIRLRIPAWSRKTELAVNGKEVVVEPGSYASIDRTWSVGDTIEMVLDLRCRLLDPPRGKWRLGDHYRALRRGPVVLARDRRLGGDIHEPVQIAEEPEGYVELMAVESPAVAARMQFSVPTLNGGAFAVVDFASAGATWDAKSEYCTWLPTREPPPLHLSWIGPDMKDVPEGAREVRVWFRGKMDVPANRTIAKVTLAMAAEGCFTCLLNGRRVARCGECLDIQVADVTSDLKPGGNLVAVEAVLPAHVRWDRNRGGIVGAVRVEYTEGAPQTLLTDMNWKVATQEEDGWIRNDFNDATWPGAQTWSWKGTGISPWNLFDRVLPVGEPAKRPGLTVERVRP